MKITRFIPIGLILFIIISGCIEEGADEKIIVDHNIGIQFAGTLTSTIINDSVIRSVRNDHLIIEVLEGVGQRGYERFDLENKVIDIDDFYFDLLLQPDEFTTGKFNKYSVARKGDHLSFELDTVNQHGIIRDNVTLSSGSSIKIIYQRHLGAIDLGPDGTVDLSRRDVLVSPFPVNGSHLIVHPCDSLRDHSVLQDTVYWSPFYDRIIEMNRSDVKEKGYFIVEQEDIEIDEFYYQTYLEFLFDNGNETLTETDNIARTWIGENEYYLVSDNLYKETLFETYQMRSLPARAPNSFFIINISLCLD